MMPSSCLATSTCLLGYRWLYVSIVVCTFSCPSRSAISSGEKPISTSRLRLEQVADYLCTIELALVKYEAKENGETYNKFFGGIGSFKRNWLKQARSKQI